eukprot:3242512-Rhodomonas_salina.2
MSSYRAPPKLMKKRCKVIRPYPAKLPEFLSATERQCDTTARITQFRSWGLYEGGRISHETYTHGTLSAVYFVNAIWASKAAANTSSTTSSSTVLNVPFTPAANSRQDSRRFLQAFGGNIAHAEKADTVTVTPDESERPPGTGTVVA